MNKRDFWFQHDNSLFLEKLEKILFLLKKLTVKGYGDYSMLKMLLNIKFDQNCFEMGVLDKEFLNVFLENYFIRVGDLVSIPELIKQVESEISQLKNLLSYEKGVSDES